MKHFVQIVIACALTVAFAIAAIYFGENNEWAGFAFRIIGYFTCILGLVVFLAWAIVDPSDDEEEEEDVE